MLLFYHELKNEKSYLKKGNEQMMLVFAGMIGAGKSSWTEKLSKYLGTEAFYESVDDNPILDKFYSNPKRWAFPLQVNFLNKRFKAIKDALRDDNNVLDRSIYEDALFTKINNMQGNITDEEMNLYNELLANMMEELEGMPKKAPDLLIYLTGDFNTILEHIKTRGRSYEQCELGDDLYQYYQLLYNEYQNWYEEYNYSPKIEINIDDLHIIEQPEEAIDYLKKKAKEVGVDLDERNKIRFIA